MSSLRLRFRCGRCFSRSLPVLLPTTPCHPHPFQYHQRRLPRLCPPRAPPILPSSPKTRMRGSQLVGMCRVGHWLLRTVLISTTPHVPISRMYGRVGLTLHAWRGCIRISILSPPSMYYSAKMRRGREVPRTKATLASGTRGGIAREATRAHDAMSSGHLGARKTRARLVHDQPRCGTRSCTRHTMRCRVGISAPERLLLAAASIMSR